MNYTLVLRMLGQILRIEAACLVLPLAVSWGTGGGDAMGFAVTIALAGVIGQVLCCLPGGERRMQARDGFAAVALSWIVMSAFGALPYVLSGAIPNYIDAFFETVSGFTDRKSVV